MADEALWPKGRRVCWITTRQFAWHGLSPAPGLSTPCKPPDPTSLRNPNTTLCPGLTSSVSTTTRLRPQLPGRTVSASRARAARGRPRRGCCLASSGMASRRSGPSTRYVGRQPITLQCLHLCNISSVVACLPLLRCLRAFLYCKIHLCANVCTQPLQAVKPPTTL